MSDVREVKVPDIGDFDTVDVIEVLVAVGDVVSEDDSLVTLESDKASMEIPSPVAGKVLSLEVAVGGQVGEGDVVAKVEVDAAGQAATAEPEPVPGESEPEPLPEVVPEPSAVVEPEASPALAVTPAAAPVPESGPASSSVASGSKVPHASPSIRRFARELGVDLSQVAGSGAKGRILREDVQRFVKAAIAGDSGRTGTGAGSRADVGGGSGIPAVPTIDFSKFGPIEDKALSRIQRASARNLWRSWLNVPHVTQFDEADVTELEAFRKSLKSEAEQRGVKLTPLAFLMKAAVAALKEFPNFNSSLSANGESLVLKRYYHLGIAVDTPKGLVVPVIRDVDQKSLYDLAAELGTVSERARAGKLSPNDIQGASFTISSLGGIGGTNFTPIVNAPEVAILGVARSKWQPVYDGQEFQPRMILPFSVSYDHRVIDGAAGARFTGFLSRVLSDVRRLVL